MPIYEYRCEACGRLHEALQKISDKPLKACPSCAKRMLKRLMSAPRFRLKGAGWYETDFKSDKEKKRHGNSLSELSRVTLIIFRYSCGFSSGPRGSKVSRFRDSNPNPGWRS